MSIHIISLIDEVDRRKHIEEQFFGQNIQFNFFNAIDPLQIVNVQDQLNLSISQNDLTKGEIGCLLSHVSLWVKLLESNESYFTIFEDDVYLSSSAHLFLKSYNWIDQGIDLIKVELFDDDVMIKLFSKIKLKNNFHLQILKNRHLGTAGYIISREGAKKLIIYIKSLKKMLPIDNVMFECFIKSNDVYQIFPALCVQDFIYNKESIVFNSYLQKERIKRQGGDISILKKNINLKYKIKREIVRLFFQIYNLHYEIWKRKLKFN